MVQPSCVNVLVPPPPSARPLMNDGAPAKVKESSPEPKVRLTFQVEAATGASVSESLPLPLVQFRVLPGALPSVTVSLPLPRLNVQLPPTVTPVGPTPPKAPTALLPLPSVTLNEPATEVPGSKPKTLSPSPRLTVRLLLNVPSRRTLSAPPPVLTVVLPPRIVPGSMVIMS